MTEDVVQVLSQLTPIMQQLAGVDLESMLQDLAGLPGAARERFAKAATNLESEAVDS